MRTSEATSARREVGTANGSGTDRVPPELPSMADVCPALVAEEPQGFTSFQVQCLCWDSNLQRKTNSDCFSCKFAACSLPYSVPHMHSSRCRTL